MGKNIFGIVYRTIPLTNSAQILYKPCARFKQIRKLWRLTSPRSPHRPACLNPLNQALEVTVNKLTSKESREKVVQPEVAVSKVDEEYFSSLFGTHHHLPRAWQVPAGLAVGSPQSDSNARSNTCFLLEQSREPLFLFT